MQGPGNDTHPNGVESCVRLSVDNEGQKRDCYRCQGFDQLSPDRLDDFLRLIPKTDLHVHLDGSVRLSTLIELAKEHNVELPAYSEEELRREVFKEHYDDLPQYLRGFEYTTKIMQKPGALERIAYEFAVDCFEEGVHYVEPRFAPQLLATKADEADIIAVLKNVNKGLERAKKEYNARQEVVDGDLPPYNYALIVCAMRWFLSNFSEYYREFCAIHKYEPSMRQYKLASVALVHAAVVARDELNLPVVGIDIAGAEAGFPASSHQETFDLAHKNFFFATCHASEDWGPESIFQAITDLHAERIGHGFHVFTVEKCSKKNPQKFVDGLVQYVAKRRILLEVCLTSNLQTMPHLNGSLKGHALKHMLEHGMCVSINTDNRLVSNTNVCRELRLAIENFTIPPALLKTIVIESFKRSFYPGTYRQKRDYVLKVIKRYEQIEREFGIAVRTSPCTQNTRSDSDFSMARISRLLECGASATCVRAAYWHGCL